MAATGTKSRFCPPLYWTARRVVWWFLRAVHRLEIRGTENIPWRGPVILAALKATEGSDGICHSDISI